MRSSFAVRTGLLKLAKSPSQRELAGRRRMLAICAMLALALTSGLLGVLSTPRADQTLRGPETGPFSYFPNE